MGRLWRADVSLEAMQQWSRDTMVEMLGICFTELGEDFLRATMPVNARTCQPYRMLHGGASVALAETLASTAANSVSDPTQAWVGQEINANHLRPALEGTVVTGTTRAFHIGGRSQVWGVEIFNEAAQRICVARVTMAATRR